MRPTLITVSGIDGTGKTTLIDGIYRELAEEGIPTTTVYGRYEPFLFKLPIWFGRKYVLSSSPDEDFATYTESKESFFDDRLRTRALEAITILDYAPYITFQYLKAVFSKEYIIFDRYVYDTIMKNLNGISVKDAQDAKAKYQSLIRLFPEPDYILYLSASIKTCMERKDDIASPDYLRQQKMVFDEFFTSLDEAIVLDAEQNESEVLADALESIGQAHLYQRSD